MADAEVQIVTNPTVPKSMVDTIHLTVEAAGTLSDHLYGYVKTGDKSCLKLAANALLQLRAMGTKLTLNELLVACMRGEDPIDGREREKLAKHWNQGEPA
jgi:hypothetical protein